MHPVKVGSEGDQDICTHAMKSDIAQHKRPLQNFSLNLP